MFSSRECPQHVHFRAINQALRCVRSDISYVRHALETIEDCDWSHVQDTVASNLSTVTLRLAGCLDGLVVLENMHAEPSLAPTASMSFAEVKFKNANLREIQKKMMSFATFWTLTDYWRCYFPYEPKPENRNDVRDFFVSFDGNDSGPIVHELICSIFNGAVEIVRMLADVIRAPKDVELATMI